MILRVLALVCLLQVAHARSRTSCGEKEFYNRLIQVCEQCRTCEEGSYEERPCTPYRDTQCIECGVVDHENEDFKEKCGVQVDQDFKDAIEVQIRGQLEKTFAIKAVKPEDEMDSKVAKELKKINDEFYEPEIISNGKEDGDADETEEIDTDEDVAFVINNLEIDDSSEEPRPKIGDGAIPGFMEVEIIELPRHLQPRKGLAFANKKRFFENEEDDLKPVAIDETADDSSDYDDEDKPEKTIVKEEEDEDDDDELKLIELEENDRRLVSFEEADDEREPFPELLPQKTKKRPIPAIRLLDPLFDLDDEEEKLKKVDEDDLDEIKEMVIERIKPHFIDFKTWKQQRRGGVMSIQWEGDDNDSDSDSDSDESSEKDIASVRKEDPSFHRHIFRAMIFTSFFLLFVVLLFWIKQLRRRNRIYHHHISRLRYLTPEERQVIERAAGFLQKPPTNIYENHVYESA